jgi:uncharacterized membrane protein
MSASFEERSVWIQLVSMLLVLGSYFVVAWQMMSQGVTALPAYVPVFAVSVILMVIVIVAGHVAVAIASRPDDRDERDRLIGWRAESHSGWLVATGVLAGITGMVLSVPNVWVAHVLLLSLFLSEVLKLVLQLVYYRRGM